MASVTLIILAVGTTALISWLIFSFLLKSRIRKKCEEQTSELRHQITTLNARLEVSQNQYHHVKQELGEKKEELRSEQQRSFELGSKLSAKENELHNSEKRLQEKNKEFDEIRKKFTTEFENIASRLLKNNSRDFAEANQKKIDEILSPLKERIEKFEKTVTETHQYNIKEQSSLRTELKNLYELNQRMADEANNLTRALKGDIKKQGNWGELLLEKVLERSGLEKDAEYQREVSLTGSDGDTYRPDVVVYLPDDKHVIIDAKVSLTAYNNMVEAETDEERRKQLKNHTLSIRNHIKSLSDKEYHLSEKLDTPDFVLLFLPIESAFSVALQNDKELFAYAWERKIVIVSPTTLLATLKTIASLWKQKKQTHNALKIAREGGKLYDRIAAFLSEFEKMEKPIKQTEKSYYELKNKLSGSQQSISRTAHRLKELGAKTSKDIPGNYLNELEEEE
ncbi:MAG: DNA recombination protein RmuC [Bacteroidales bacterium]|nr:DNA recombination protein RmuC [Bacteroidales bacterium]